MVQAVDTAGVEPAEEEMGVTEQELKELHLQTEQARSRFQKIAASLEKSDQPSLATLYREVASEVLGVVSDLITQAAAAFIDIEDRVMTLEDGDLPTASALDAEDSGMYVALFDQHLRLVDGLIAMLPDDGAEQQRQIYEALRRMTVERRERTLEITMPPEEEEPEEPEDEDEEETAAETAAREA